jgi:hypothetical protein
MKKENKKGLLKLIASFALIVGFSLANETRKAVIPSTG